MNLSEFNGPPTQPDPSRHLCKRQGYEPATEEPIDAIRLLSGEWKIMDPLAWGGIDLANPGIVFVQTNEPPKMTLS